MRSPLSARPPALASVLAALVWTLPARAIESELFTAQELVNPLYVTAVPGDPRVFVVDQSGLVQIYDQGGAFITTFLDVSDLIAYGGEQGLLGMAFSPSFATDRRFFVNYTDLNGNTIVARYRASASDPDHAEPTGRIVLEIDQPFANHNGGRIVFGPDGNLYVGMGDGGSGGDPLGNGQDLESLLGKILRVNVNTAFSTTYTIPQDNPFVGVPGRDEIWAYGLRNPWGVSFDPATGDLYVADVGQGDWEEVDVQPAASEGGENYGWNIMEGRHCYEPPSGCDQSGLVLPVHEYSHAIGGCSITGGQVYRGSITEIQGLYFFADFCTAHVWTFRWDGGGGITDLRDRTEELRPETGAIETISGFGADGFGELYITDLLGEVYRVRATDTVDVPEHGVVTPIAQAAPNPFQGVTKLRLGVPEGAAARVSVHDAQGRLVRVLVDGPAPLVVSWDGLDEDGHVAAAGVYVVQIEHEGRTSKTRVAILR